MKKLSDIIGEGIFKPIKGEHRLFEASCSPERFKTIFLEAATNRLFYGGSTFIVDENNKAIINQLYHYLRGSVEFTGDHRKGILLIGNIGNGKTILMESFIEVFNKTSSKIITNIHFNDIERYKADNRIGYLDKRPLYIDDIAIKQEQVNIYGTKVNPFEDLIDQRYRNRGLTFGTSNYSLKDFKYTPRIKDRLTEMFNIINLPGESRRKYAYKEKETEKGLHRAE